MLKSDALDFTYIAVEDSQCIQDIDHENWTIMVSRTVTGGSSVIVNRKFSVTRKVSVNCTAIVIVTLIVNGTVIIIGQS